MRKALMSATTLVRGAAVKDNDMPDEITMGELARRLDRHEKRIDEQFASVTRQIDALQFVSRDAFNALVQRVDQLEESGQWRYRLLAGSLVTLAIALIGVIMGLVSAR